MGAVLGREDEGVDTGLCGRANADVGKEEIGVLRLGLLDDLDARGAADADIEGGKVLALDHKLERGLHADPPGEGLNSYDLFGSCGGDVGKVVGAAGCCEERQQKDGGFSHFIISNMRSRTSSIEPVPSTSR